MLALLAISGTAFAPGAAPLSTIRTAAAVRPIGMTAPQFDKALLPKLGLTGTVAASMANIPTWAVASSSDYMSAEDEEKQSIVLGIIGLLVFLGPITGIQMARGAISSMADEDDDRFRGNTDPEWGVTPGAQRKAKNRALQARLDAEKETKKFPWQR